MFFGITIFVACNKSTTSMNSSPSTLSIRNHGSLSREIHSGDVPAMAEDSNIIIGTVDDTGLVSVSSFNIPDWTYNNVGYVVQELSVPNNAVRDSALYLEMWLVNPSDESDREHVAIPIRIQTAQHYARGTTTTTTNSCSGCSSCSFLKDGGGNITGCFCEDTKDEPDPNRRGKGCQHTVTTTTTNNTKIAAFRAYLLATLAEQQP